MIGEFPSRCVLIQLVEHDKQERPRQPRLLLGVEGTPDRHADNEALPPVGEVVEVDDGDLGLGGGDAVFRTHRDIGANQWPESTLGSEKASDEGIRRAGTDRGARPMRSCAVVAQPLDNEINELAVGAKHLALNLPGPVVAYTLPRLQDGRDIVDHEGVLVPVVLGVSEDERHELLLAEFGKGPVVAVDPGRPSGDIGPARWSRRDEEAHKTLLS